MAPRDLLTPLLGQRDETLKVLDTLRRVEELESDEQETAVAAASG